jgi:hypothetical protein
VHELRGDIQTLLAELDRELELVEDSTPASSETGLGAEP